MCNGEIINPPSFDKRTFEHLQQQAMLNTEKLVPLVEQSLTKLEIRPEFNLTLGQAIKLILNGLSHDNDDFWANLVTEFYDEKTNTMPTIYDVLRAFGVTKEEIDRVKENLILDDKQ